MNKNVNQKNKITHASIIPLIGGEPLGLSKALGDTLPEYVLSYPAFERNDSHYINYLEKQGWDREKYIVLKDTNDPGPKLDPVDIICCTAPCAGLSSLNVKSGHGCPVNDWMYCTAEYALKNIKPKVFWGENAPRLATKAGEPVRNRLREIAKQYGYSFSTYKTASIYHGCPQKRPRTFYFLWKNETAPIMEWYKKELKPYGKTLGKLKKKDPMAVPTNLHDTKPSENPYYRYLLEEVYKMDHAEFCKTIDTDISIIFHVEKVDNGFSKFIEWSAKEGYDKVSKRAEAMQAKLDDGKGYWGHGLTAVPFDGIAPSYIGNQPFGLMHPKEDRFLTIREGLRLMGMPDDFELLGGRKNVNHICQNVPVLTAACMAEQCVKFVSGELTDSGSPYIMQDNYKEKSEYIEPEINTVTLDAFIG